MNKTEMRILDAAFDVLAQDYSAPLERVAEAAGVTRMTLHRYYNSRETLLTAMTSEMIEQSNHIIDRAIAQYESPREQLREIVSQASQMGERFHFLLHAAEGADHHTPAVQELDERMIEIIEAMRANGDVKKGVPNAWILHLYGGVLTAAWSSYREGAVAPRDIPDLAWRSLAQGLFTADNGR